MVIASAKILPGFATGKFSLIVNGGPHKWSTRKWMVYDGKSIKVDDLRVLLLQETPIT